MLLNLLQWRDSTPDPNKECDQNAEVVSPVLKDEDFLKTQINTMSLSCLKITISTIF